MYETRKLAYHKRYYNATIGGYSPCIGTLCHGTSSKGSQTSNAMALAIGAPPTAAIANLVAANLAADVKNFGDKTTCGVVGMAWLFPVLDAYGYSERALAVLEGDMYP